MDFYKSISKIGKEKVLYAPKQEVPKFIQEEKILNELSHIVKNGCRVFVYGDYDADGAYSVEIIRRAFDYLGHDNYECFKYVGRTHSVDVSAVNKAITEGFEYMIICDAGSSDPDLMMRLHMMGVKVMLFDHHQTPFSYHDFPHTFMINTSIENRVRDEEVIICTGALVYLVFDKLILKLGRPELKSLSALALCSLYADVIDMTSDICRYIYYKAMSLSKSQLPVMVQRFMGEYDVFTRRFIEYRLNPKINSMFRSESFDVLNRFLFWSPSNNSSILDIVDSMDKLYERDRNEVAKASDLLEHEVLNHFVIGNLSSVAGMINIPEEKLHNYTGLVANQLATKYNKTAIVYADSGVDVKGSLRDLYGRNYLELFKKFCDARGHNAAFGIHIKYFEFSEVLSYIRMIDQHFFINTVSNEPIIVPHNERIPDTKLLSHMAIYNEFSGVGAPNAFVSKVWLETTRPLPNSGYYHKYPWGPYKIKSNNPIRIGSEVIIKPYKGWVTKTNGGVELLVSEVTR